MYKSIQICSLAFAAIFSGMSLLAENQIPWSMEKLSKAPKVFSTEMTNDIKKIFYEGVPYQGKQTRVFAYYAVPSHPKGQKVPGIVLIHGGGGSAFYRWVKLWNDRGYAAISMDTCGCISGNVYGEEQSKHRKHQWAGPVGWGGFYNTDDPITDQWTYHAVADSILGHSFLRSLPDVDPDRIGVTGISWGGYLTCIVAGVDNRFAFAAPVYGCGFFDGPSVLPGWINVLKKIGKERAKKWISLWDPQMYLGYAKMPFLWVDGSNDFAYPLDSLQKSYLLPKGERILCTRLRMPHGHGAAGENPQEILTFANQIVCKGAPLPKITKSECKNRFATVQYAADPRLAPVKAYLNVTADKGVWQKRFWKALPAVLSPTESTASALLPKGTTVYYINLECADGQIVSTPHQEF